jgi:hypothetical protein
MRMGMQDLKDLANIISTQNQSHILCIILKYHHNRL